MIKKNKKIKPSPPDNGGVPPTFESATFMSSSDKEKLSYNNSKRKQLVEQRRKSVRSQRNQE
jgi:hypothetical protein